ncbi:hypothetical protein [Nonomuraea fuscirosea]
MGRHAKPRKTMDQPQEPAEDSGQDDNHPGKGRHAKDHALCTAAPPAEQS